MNNYEITFIIAPDMAELDAQKIEAKIHNSITKKGGTLLSNNFWGKHQFAYPIDKHDFGYYATVVFSLAPEEVDEFIKELQLMPEVLRHLLISLDKEKIRVEDLKRMDFFSKEAPAAKTPAPRSAAPRRAPAAAPKPAAPKKDEATRLKELDEKLGDILNEEEEK